VHPNRSKSKLDEIQKLDAYESAEEKSVIAKFIKSDKASKIIFTHMASFIVGATLLVFFQLI